MLNKAVAERIENNENKRRNNLHITAIPCL